MTKHFETRQEAETELAQFRFKLISTGSYVNDHCVAMIHPLPGSAKVRVFYAERA